MAIELICQRCSAKLRVPDEHAGKKARCPSCGAVTDVPSAERLGLGGGAAAAFGSRQAAAKEPFGSPGGGSAPPFGGATASDAGGGFADTAAEKWYVKTPEGYTYGPVARDELNAWVAQGRVTAADALLQDGQNDWRPAGNVFPALGAARHTAVGYSGAAGEAWKTGAPASSPSASDFSGIGTNPYASPGTRTIGHLRFGPRGYMAPHRGGTILVLGIVSLVVCNFFMIPGLAAWIMGQTDLREMSAGRMDPAGRGMTVAGMILGIIATVLYGLMFVLPCLAALVGGG